MKNKNRFSKWVWLVLVVVFAAIAGGACGGSSSGNGGGGGGEDEIANVTEIDKSEHPLAGHLRELYHKMPEGTLFLSENITGERLAAVKDRLKAAHKEGKIIGMFAPTKARIDELHDVLGVDIFRKQTEAEIAAAAAGEEADVEFYMIKLHDGLIFQNRQHYVGKGTPGAEFYQRGPFLISGDQEISDYAVEEPVEPVGDKSEAYPRIAAAIASWNGLVADHAVKVKAEGPSVSAELRAAEDPNPNQLEKLAHAITNTDHFHFSDQKCNLSMGFGHDLRDDDSKDNKDCDYRFPVIYITATMYSCYSFESDDNWYMVVMNASMNNEDNYHHWRATGNTDSEQNATRRYYSKPEMQFISDPNDDKKLWLHPDNQPKNYNDGYTDNKGFSFNVNGSVGITPSLGTNTGVSGNLGLSAGIGISHNQSFNIKDYKAIDHTNGKKPWTEYEFSLPAQDSGGYMMNLHEASDASRTNFTSEESWSWRVARSQKNAYSFTHNFRYNVVLVQGGGSVLFIPLDWIPGCDMASWEAGGGKGYTIHLPIPPTLAVSVKELSVNKEGHLTSGGETVKFDIFSDGPWTLESDSDWVTISHPSGSKTSQQEITLSIKPNPSPDFRYATITATGTPDPNGKIQKTSFQITQEPDNTK